MNPRVVFHIDASGNVEVFSDEGVDVFSVYDLTPQDRVYKYSHNSIPDGLLGESHGFARDGSAAHARVTRAVRDAFGLPAFEIVEAEK